MESAGWQGDGGEQAGTGHQRQDGAGGRGRELGRKRQRERQREAGTGRERQREAGLGKGRKGHAGRGKEQQGEAGRGRELRRREAGGRRGNEVITNWCQANPGHPDEPAKVQTTEAAPH